MADGYNVVSKRPSKDSTGKMATACYGGAFAADESVIFRADFANTSGVPGTEADRKRFGLAAE